MTGQLSRYPVGREVGRTDFLKAAVQQYASHIWNDIKGIVERS